MHQKWPFQEAFLKIEVIHSMHSKILEVRDFQKVKLSFKGS